MRVRLPQEGVMGGESQMAGDGVLGEQAGLAEDEPGGHRSTQGSPCCFGFQTTLLPEIEELTGIVIRRGWK